MEGVHYQAAPASQLWQALYQSIAFRAGIAHIYFESIRPLEDGNGRIGRSISQAAAQAVSQPAILAHHKRYYEDLERANRRIDIIEGLTWFAGIALEAQRRSIVRVEFVIAKTKLLDRLRGKIKQDKRELS
jgi:Fic family protein